jgi:hypothetical protein
LVLRLRATYSGTQESSDEAWQSTSENKYETIAGENLRQKAGGVNTQMNGFGYYFSAGGSRPPAPK